MKIMFSIVIPTLNSKKYIERCLNSIFRQSFRNYEVIVIDGGSTDGTLNLLKKYKKRIRLFRNKNDTQSKAINLGIVKSKGKWITWQNSDDFYENENALLSFAKSISINPNKLLFTANILLVNYQEKILRDVKYVEPFFLSLLYEDMTMTNQACFWNKKIHKKIGYLKNININFDYEWFLRILKNYPNSGHHINEILACFRLHKNQKTQNQVSKDFLTKTNIKNQYGYKKNFSYLFKFILFFRRFILYLLQGNFYYILRGFIKTLFIKKNKEYISN